MGQTKPFLLTFTPADRFFFGSAVTFNDDYYVVSDRFPQNTTVMGALRAAFLYGSGLLLQHRKGQFVPRRKRDEAVALTGHTALHNLEGESACLGVIQKLSPLFLVKRDENGAWNDILAPVPADVVMQKETKKFRLTGFEVRNAPTCNRGLERNMVLKSDLNPKEEFSGLFLGGRVFWETYLSDRPLKKDLPGIVPSDRNQGGPFVSNTQTGIGLERRRAKEKQLYVKTDYAFQPGHAFGVLAWLEEKGWDAPLPGTITLGGERSVFLLERIDLSAAEGIGSHPLVKRFQGKDANTVRGEWTKVVFLSPAAGDTDPLLSRMIHGVMPDTGALRMLKSAAGGRKSRNSYGFDKTDAHRVLPAGSVLYIKTHDGISMPEPPPAARALGLNVHLTLPWQPETQQS